MGTCNADYINYVESAAVAGLMLGCFRHSAVTIMPGGLVFVNGGLNVWEMFIEVV